MRYQSFRRGGDQIGRDRPPAEPAQGGHFLDKNAFVVLGSCELLRSRAIPLPGQWTIKRLVENFRRASRAKGRMAMFMPEGEKRIFAPKVQGALQRGRKSVSSGVTDQDPICFTL